MVLISNIEKANSIPMYIDTTSEHLPTVTKLINKSIADRLATNSSNVEIFVKVNTECDAVLKIAVTIVN